MQTVRSGDADIVYESVGQGPPVVLFHPFPVHRDFWKPVSPPSRLTASSFPTFAGMATRAPVMAPRSWRNMRMILLAFSMTLASGARP